MLFRSLLPVCNRTAPLRADEPPPLISLDELERQHILGIYKQTGFHKSKTAEILGVSRKTLDRKLMEYKAE